jgi:hypothetical protein
LVLYITPGIGRNVDRRENLLVGNVNMRAYAQLRLQFSVGVNLGLAVCGNDSLGVFANTMLRMVFVITEVT